MKWSERVGHRASWAAVLAGAMGVAALRPGLAGTYHRLRATTDVYGLPPPGPLVVASLGYRSALADLVFSHLLVAHGLHFQENRRLEFTAQYLDAVTALDPRYVEPYRLADTLLTLTPEGARLEDFQKAREVLLRGVAERPFDAELHLIAGQYLAFLARPHLPDVAMREEWKLEGARLLSRACELADRNSNIPYHCIVAAQLFERGGEREAAIESLRRVIAVTDDPEIERLALGYLRTRLSEREQERQDRRRRLFREAWKADLPALSKNAMLALAPAFDPARCAGAEGGTRPGCETSWRAWAERNDPVGD